MEEGEGRWGRKIGKLKKGEGEWGWDRVRLGEDEGEGKAGWGRVQLLLFSLTILRLLKTLSHDA